MDQPDVVESQIRFRRCQCGGQPLGSADLEPGGQQVARVEAVGDRKIAALADPAQLFERAAQMAPRANRVLHQNLDYPEAKAFRSRRQPVDQGRQPVLDSAAPVASGMQDQVIRADRRGPFQLGAERSDRFRTNDRIA